MKIYCHQTPELGKAQWYLKPFMIYTFKDRGLEIGFSVPFKVFGKWLWYLIPLWLVERQISKCINYIPDCGSKMDGTKIKPLLGYVISTEENGLLNKWWWKDLRKYKVDPKMIEIENDNKEYSNWRDNPKYK